MDEGEKGKRMKIIEMVLVKMIVGICGICCMLSLGGCSSDSFSYSATIAEGRAAAAETIEKTGASSISLALVEGDRVVWAEAFGLADKESATAPGPETMYCIGSTSKMLAAIAAMKLVDQGRISLDTPIENYIPSFSMLSPEYGQVTVRMLLDHASGFPGTDNRNSETSSPLPFDFSAQILETLGTQRLKHPPGYLSVYCNDGFTMIEQLVLAVTGRSFAQFVQDEIFDTLGMNHSRYPLDYFPDGSYAKRYDEEDAAMPQMFLNAFASGGLYSTPSDMAKVAMMLIGGGKLGNVRLLSQEAVAAMGVDQTLESFNPVKAYSTSYGLGWDTVCQPGLGAVDVLGWQKGGDVTKYGSVMTIAPEEGLAVVVMGASGSFTSGSATTIAERVLLRALVEKGWIPAMPSPLKLSPGPEKTPTEDLLDSVRGYYANNSVFLRVSSQSGSLNVDKYDTGSNGWETLLADLKLRDDDRFTSDENPSQSVSFISAEERMYMVLHYLGGYGHYQDLTIQCEKLVTPAGVPATWSGRLGRKWLMTNEHPDSDTWSTPVMALLVVDNLFFADWLGLEVVNPFFSDDRAGMMLLIPQMNGRDLNDVVIENRDGGEWIRFGSYLFRPRETVVVLSDGDNAVEIGAEGSAEWRAIDAAGTKSVTIAPAAPDGRWKLYNNDLKRIESGEGAESVTLSGGRYYLLLFSDAGVHVE